MAEESSLNKETLSLKIGRAIKKGAPLFNEGDKKGCFDIYLEAAKSSQFEGVVYSDVADLLSKAVPEAESLGEKQDYVEGAWVLRRCFNKILKIERARAKDKKLTKELLELANTVESSVDLADRKHLLKTYSNCFVGKDAVTKLVETGTATSRAEATKMLGSLHDAGFIEHVARDHNFQDAKLFYKFNKNVVKEVLESSKRDASSQSHATDHPEQRNDEVVAANEEEDIEFTPNSKREEVKGDTQEAEERAGATEDPALGDATPRSSDAEEKAHAPGQEQDAYNDGENSVTEGGSEPSSREVNGTASVEKKASEASSGERPYEVRAASGPSGAPVKDIEFNPNSKVDEAQGDAKDLGEKSPVVEDSMGDATARNAEEKASAHEQEENPYNEAESAADPSGNKGSFAAEEEGKISESPFAERPKSASGPSHPTFGPKGGEEKGMELAELARKMELVLDIRDRKHRLKTYESCFVGNEAVAVLADNGIATSRQEAVEVMGKLLNAGFIEHVTGEHDFQDAKLFYRFVRKDANPSSFAEFPNGKLDHTRSLTTLAAKVKVTVDIADRKHRLKTYKECFVGKDAVTKLVEESIFVNRTEATTKLSGLNKAGFIEHVTGEHEFEDAPLFYRFTPEAESARLI